MNSLPPRSGATLIELLVVLAIMALAFGLAVPALSSVGRSTPAANPADSAVQLAVSSGAPTRLRAESSMVILALPDGRALVSRGPDAQ